MATDNYKQFIETSYSGRELLKKHKLDEFGTWKIVGEDPNCDLGGPHLNPYLETVEGTLDEVIRYAVELRGFWQWGAGGKIVKTTPVRNVADILRNRERVKEIDKQIAVLLSEKKRLEGS